MQPAEFDDAGRKKGGWNDPNRRKLEWVDVKAYDPKLSGVAPRPGKFSSDTRYNFDNAMTNGGVVNPTNNGKMTCDICGNVGHGAAECGAKHSGQPLTFEKDGVTHYTWRFLWENGLCGPFGLPKRK